MSDATSQRSSRYSPTSRLTRFARPRNGPPANVREVVRYARGRDSVRLPFAGAVLGAVAGAILGHRLRMTVPHGCKTGCAPDYGISGAVAGAVWGTLSGLLAMVARRGWRPVVGVVATIVLLALLTIYEPK